MKSIHAWIIGALSVLVPSGQLLAHHSFAAEYDANKVIELKGVVTKIEWTNPHVRFYMDVRDDKGVSSWDLELQSANTLTRDGWDRDALKVGEQITVSAWLARDGSKRGNARGSITLADGSAAMSGERRRAAGGEIKR